MVLALLSAALFPSRAHGRDTAAASLVGTWTTEEQGARVRMVFNADGTFTRTATDAAGTTTLRGQYRVENGLLIVEPQGRAPTRLAVQDFKKAWLLLGSVDSKMQDMAHDAADALRGATPTNKPAPTAAAPADNAPAPAPGKQHAATRPARQAAGNPLCPDWVRPGLRLTYYLLTGSVSGSVNGLVLDKDGEITDQAGNHYSHDRLGHSSHGLIEATVAGLDAQVVALVQPFYIFSATDSTTPTLLNHQDAIVTADSGGDFWMHPQKQAQMRQQHPWTGVPRPGQLMACTTTWRDKNQSWTATEVLSPGDTGKTLWVYDQATGRLLYLSRLSRNAPDIRDPSQTLRDPVSYATFLRFVGVRQLSLPWLDSPLPEWAQQLQGLSYRGRSSVVFPEAAPGAGQAITQNLEVTRRGGSWLLFQSKGKEQGLIGESESKAVTGTGSATPLIIPPDALARLRPGQELDRDPYTKYTLRVAAADPQKVALQFDGPRQSMSFTYDRAQGLLIHSLTRERSTAGTNMFLVREMQLAGKR